MDTRWPGLPYAQWAETRHTLHRWTQVPQAVLYACLSPAPAGVETIRPDPQQARWVPGAGEFVLPWDELVARTDPDAAALEFFTSTYTRTTALAGWDHSALELPRIPESEAS